MIQYCIIKDMQKQNNNSNAYNDKDDIFSKAVPDFAEIVSFGFEKQGDMYIWQTDFMQSDFCAIIKIHNTGKVETKVIDKMNDTEYLPLKSSNRNSPYVAQVRDAFNKILQNIVDKCFTKLLFSSAQANRIGSLITKTYGVEADFPFSKDPYKECVAFRHKENQKWFALFMNVPQNKLNKTLDATSKDIVNLKIEPDTSQNLFDKKAVYPAYHMNHRQWASVVLDDTQTDDFVMQQVAKSFELTK